MSSWCPVRKAQCINDDCADQSMCVLSEEPPTRERKETMMEGNFKLKEKAEKKLRGWMTASPEEIRRDLDTFEAVRHLDTTELDILFAIGNMMADQKRVETPSPKPKRGRPLGAKTAKKESGNGE